jgi:ribosomal protein S18 acetylase RimI-like enzyme
MNTLYEIIGYTGSVLVALSLSMKNIRLLRKLNLAGAFIFSMYGLIIGAFPVFVLNGYIALIDVYYLYKMYKTKELFQMVSVQDNKHKYLIMFLDFYWDDIKKYFPGFSRKTIEEAESFFLLRDLRPVGLFIYKKISDKEIMIELDYVIPDYRDMKSGEYLYNTEVKYLKKEGYEKLITKTEIEVHKKYLEHLGFKKTEKNNSVYIKII